MSHTLSENGFMAVKECSTYSPDCVSGACWHMGVFRQMMRRWFDILGPEPRGCVVEEEPEEWFPSKSSADRRTAKERERDCIAKYVSIYGRMPSERTESKFGHCGIGCYPQLDGERNDIDGTGSWGHGIRLLEDIDNERPLL